MLLIPESVMPLAVLAEDILRNMLTDVGLDT
jgi:hypothetical protein